MLRIDIALVYKETRLGIGRPYELLTVDQLCCRQTVSYVNTDVTRL